MFYGKLFDEFVLWKLFDNWRLMKIIWWISFDTLIARTIAWLTQNGRKRLSAKNDFREGEREKEERERKREKKREREREWERKKREREREREKKRKREREGNKKKREIEK